MTSVPTSRAPARAGQSRPGHVDRAVLDGMLNPFVMFQAVRDESGVIVDFEFAEANRAACEYNQVAYEDLVGARVLDLLPGHAESGLFAQYVHVVETGEPMVLDDFVYPNELLEGSPRRYDVRAVKVGDGMSYSWADVTDRYEAVQALAESERQYRLLAENATDIVWQIDEEGRIEWVSESVTRILGWRREDLLGTFSIDLAHPDDRAAALAARESVTPGVFASFEFRFRCADGTYRWLALSAHGVMTARGPSRIAGLRDITAEVAAREDLAHLAFHDELTGLRNRAWIKDVLESDLLAARRESTQVAVLFIDQDHFKVVNDSLGHPAGDQLLRDVAERVAGALRPGDRVGRFGGDEFIVVATGITDPLDVETIAERISHAVAAPLTIHGHVLVPTVSIGIALSGPDSTPESLLRDTDAALFRAKRDGRARWQFFDETMHTEAVTRLTTETEIRQALAEQQFVVHYQPIVDLLTGDVAGHEALVRWQHPTRGLLPPSEFIPVAEDCGLITGIEEHVLAAVLQMLTTHPGLPGQVSINVSPVSITRAGWATSVAAALTSSGIDPHRLCIEITETAALSILDSPHDDLHRLRDLGIGLHVDDFGTGYSSLTLLRDLPVTGLKLDLSFTQNLHTDTPARVLAEGLSVLARGLALTAIAEGIETTEQAALLREQGWTHGQGYLFGRPGRLPSDGASGAR